MDVILYDGACPFCRAQVARLKHLLIGSTIEYRSFREDGVLERFPGLSLADCDRAIQLITQSGTIYSGAAAIVKLLRRTRLSPLVLPYYVPGIRQLGNAFYDYVGRNRHLLHGPGTCNDQVCAQPAAAAAPPRWKVQGLVVGLLISCLVAVLVAEPYQWFLDHIPLGFFNALATVGFGLILGVALGCGLWIGRARAPTWTLVLALICATAAQGTSFYHASSRTELVAPSADELAENPQSVFRARRALPHDHLKIGHPIRGSLVIWVWIFEFMLLWLAAFFLARHITHWPQCPDCGRWAKKRRIVHRPVDPDELRADLSNGRLDTIFNGPAAEDSIATLEVWALECSEHPHRWISAILRDFDRSGRSRKESILDQTPYAGDQWPRS